MSEIKVTAASIARLAYGYELMFQALCHIAGTSGGSPHWFTHKGQEVTARVDPLWKLSEDSNPHKPGDCLSQHVPFAEWAASVEKRADALEHWRQEVGKLHSQIEAKDSELAKLREENEALRQQLVRMVDIAESRLMAIHKAIEPSSFGINGIESAEDHVTYMHGILNAAFKEPTP